ncbi:MAG: iron-only hydrogenase system regulator [Clostridiales bacterium]|nr:iron-only hydrogenase system regulator [Clostridiales bacterium]
MTTRVALIAIIVEQGASTEELNRLLHEAGGYIIGRMGIPYRAKGVNIISVAIDAPQDIISTLAGRIGRLAGITAKTVYSHVVSEDGKNGEGEEKSAQICHGFL